MPETPRRTPNQRHAFLLAACLLLACLPAPRASAHGRAAGPPPQTGGQEEEERPLRRPGGLKRFGTNVLDFLKCKKANVRMRQELLDYGPQFPERYNASDFSFKAIVNTNWPMTIEYELEQQGTAVVRIEVMGNLPFTQTLKGGGMGERRTARFTLPSFNGEGPHPALITLKATLDGTREREPARFRLLGMAAGDDAVAAVPGSRPLEVAALGPPPHGVFGYAPAPQRCACASKLCNVQLNATSGGGYAYSFCVATAKFHRWAADIMRRVPVKNTDDYVRIGRVKNVARRIGPDQRIDEAWDGRKPGGRRVRAGMYSVFVMVWWSGSSMGPWAFSNPSKHVAVR